MRDRVRQSAFSLVEMVVVLAVILILAGALLGVGRYLTVRASVDLTKSQLEIIATALQQYYDDFDKFPFDTPDTNGNGFFGDDYLVADLEAGLQGVVSGTLPDYEAINSTPPPDTFVISSASSAALFYYLDKNPNSRKIVEALTDSLISSMLTADQTIQIALTAGQTIDLPRFIDAWGTSIRYEYIDGTAFPTLTSAGPDMTFGTDDDIVN